MKPPTFEETYPRYEFSELVRLGIACAVLVRRCLDRKAVIPAIRQAELPQVTAPTVLEPEA
jgi:hypothetical protein